MIKLEIAGFERVMQGGWKTEVFWTKKPTTQEPDVVSSPNFAWWAAF